MNEKYELTDKQIGEIYDEPCDWALPHMITFARAIITADRALRPSHATMCPNGLQDALKQASREIAAAGHAGWGNLCSDAQAAIAAKDAEIAALKKQSNAYGTIVKSQEGRLSTLHESSKHYAEAVNTLASERQANAILTNEIAALRKDAERYQRIRNGPGSDMYGDVYAMSFQGDGDIPVDGEELDRFVDAAMTKEPK
jgi:hypothetical protein